MSGDGGLSTGLLKLIEREIAPLRARIAALEAEVAGLRGSARPGLLARVTRRSR